ncbi:MAG: acyl-CoA dehydrogenase family protein, partial [Cyanobacteria bacterium REEB65]|nr:acyl-CoA dehydrogenase family protein [Cyanobacteria bacterium REEB65]
MLPTAGLIGVLLAFAFFGAYLGRVYWAWVLPIALWLGWWGGNGGLGQPAHSALLAAFLVVAIVTGFRPLRRAILSRGLLKVVRNILPKMGDTERIALEAGTVWWDGELFTGSPQWRKLLEFKNRGLSDRERAFVEGPVEQICHMIDDWQVELDRDLPPEIWDFLKKNKFFGMIIPEEYGGLGFSAAAHSAVVLKLASRSSTMGTTVMVPNSLGPAELLLHYGTEEQKNYYLPRLAIGQEIPCFALTEPQAGSDAAAASSSGVVCKGTWQGQEIVGMRLHWDKRYCTLAPLATVIGLAFRLSDPDGLLGEVADLGITCALIPSNLPGIAIGKRHDPLGNHFLNGPLWGHDVF